MKMTSILAAALIGALVISNPVSVHAQDSENAPPPAACESPEYRQFDFWIGDWDVTSNGQPAGANTIEPVHGGCALLENWQGVGAGGISGSSFNLYDRVTGRWHQSWVDASGNLLLLDGGREGNDMVLAGERPSQDGQGTVLHRIRWTPNPDGSVRQLWEASQDAGANWSVLFDGLYKKRAESP